MDLIDFVCLYVDDMVTGQSLEKPNGLGETEKQYID